MVIVLGFISTSPALAQYYLAPHLTHGTDAANDHAFLINPATSIPTNRRLEAGFGRQTREVTITDTQAGQLADEQKLKSSEDSFGVGLNSSLGAGAAAGVTMEKLFRINNNSITTSTDEPKEYFGTTHLAGRLALELNPGLTVGFVLRYLTEHVSMSGAFNIAESERIVYDATLYGYGGGVAYTNKVFSIGAAYLPPLTGKATILEEQRIVTEAGVMHASTNYRTQSKLDVGLAYHRPLHKRDDRDTTVTLASGRTVSLRSIDPDQNLFLYDELMVGLGGPLTQAISLKVSGSMENHEFIFNNTDVPQGNGSEKMKAYKGKAGLKMTSGSLNLEGGYGLVNRKHSFTRQFSNEDRTYEAKVTNLYLLFGVVF